MFFDPDNTGAPSPDMPSPRGLVVWVRNKFLTGLAVITPVIVTWWILQFVYKVLHDWSLPLQQFSVSRINELAGEQIIDPASTGFLMFEKFVGVLIPLAALIALGVLASNVIGRQVVEAIERLLLRVPFISFIYKTLKQVIDAFKNFGGKAGFKRVVNVDYPSTGAWMIGFVTGYFHEKNKKKDMDMVFVPGALIPMTVLLLVVEKERLMDAPMSMEEAMKMIFSGGLVGPDSPGSKRPSTAPAPVPVAMPHDLPPGLPVADTDDHPASEPPTMEPAPVLATTAGAPSKSKLRRAFSALTGA
jgi:uncharacterized membrane protein